MISQLTLINYQSHKNTTLDLHPGVNCIVGSSDVGKTAILRALRWLVWNRPSGDSFRSVWGGETSVTVEIGGHQISRVKNTGHNAYSVDGVILSAVRTDVPTEVGRILNFNELNLQSQFDRPFLLDISPGEVAAHFNRIAHLDTIDTATRNVAAWIRSLESDITNHTQQLTELRTQLRDYDNLDELDRKVTELERLDSDRNELEVRKQTLLQILKSLSAVAGEIAGYEKTAHLAIDVNAILNLLGNRKAQCSHIQTVRDLLFRLDRTYVNLDVALRSVDKAEEEFRQAFPTVCPLCGKPR